MHEFMGCNTCTCTHREFFSNISSNSNSQNSRVIFKSACTRIICVRIPQLKTRGVTYSSFISLSSNLPISDEGACIGGPKVSAILSSTLDAYNNEALKKIAGGKNIGNL